MALLTLKDIGKIYVSDGNVAVGIRGVNLLLDRGEFVAITGKSGSGKSTLLNVISGMDSYEEGELYIEGQPTSHYLQPEWEEYRQKYISFIFQDYNIIESFSVLQNVELALMHIEDKAQRRARALELISRVGLSSHIKQKGSKLSGGQKQRTVIARALAKDSPIILADEPTGNLDSATSKEIIELLREVSRDKLLIVVTHNFEQVQEHATRHIRIFDGGVESDHIIRERAEIEQPEPQEKSEDKGSELKKQIKNGITLGRAIFTSKPKLSLFLCLLMLIGTMGIFLVTTLCGGASELFEPYYMFNHIDGRLVLTTQNGQVLTEEEVQKISKEYGAKDYLRFDVLLDAGESFYATVPSADAHGGEEYIFFECTYGQSFGDDIIGRYPEANDEVLLYLPISYQPIIGKDKIETGEIIANIMCLKVTGVKYYYDNNIVPKCLFTEDGFRTATAVHYLLNYSSLNINLSLSASDGSVSQRYMLDSFIPSFDMEKDKIYINPKLFEDLKELEDGATYNTTVDFSAIYYNYDYYYGDSSESLVFAKSFKNEDITDKKPTVANKFEHNMGNCVFISDELLCQMAESVLNNSYKQVSLFFENDSEAHEAAKRLHEAGYIAVVSDTTYEPDAFTTITTVISCLMTAISWVLSILFLAFFINLCSARALGAFKGDMAIMRSMGIPVNAIRVGMYVRMLISLVPAFIMVVLTAILIYTTPKFNGLFVYLYAWQYALIFIGMIALTARITYKQIRKLFGETVKKSLKGGGAE